ncbi:MAG: hypothetical protein AB4058_18755, partial [Microcystaceae cyanobacterium]
DSGLSTIVKTVDGITLTVSNPSPATLFSADSDGIVAFGNLSTETEITNFDLSFSAPVQLISYNVGYIQQLEGDESITLTAGSSSSIENSPFATGTRNFANQFTVAAGQTISVSGFGVDTDDIIQWSAIEVTPADDPVTTPEPSALLSLFALGGLGAKSAFKKLK